MDFEFDHSQKVSSASSHAVRKRPKLLRTIIEVNAECPKYLPNFLPVLPSSISRSTISGVQFEDDPEQRVQNSAGQEFPKQFAGLRETLRSDSKVSRPLHTKGRIFAAKNSSNVERALRSSHVEHEVLSKAGSLIDGSCPVLDNF